eukprot:200673-Pelagomonas_calceolata.AAC.2
MWSRRALSSLKFAGMLSDFLRCYFWPEAWVVEVYFMERKGCTTLPAYKSSLAGGLLLTEDEEASTGGNQTALSVNDHSHQAKGQKEQVRRISVWRQLSSSDRGHRWWAARHNLSDQKGLIIVTLFCDLFYKTATSDQASSCTRGSWWSAQATDFYGGDLQDRNARHATFWVSVP